MSQEPSVEKPHPANFPVIHGKGETVPWAFLQPHESQAKSNHGGQTLRRLAERGGLCWLEMLWVITGQGWNASSLTEVEAKTEVMKRLTIWSETLSPVPSTPCGGSVP